MTSHAQQPLLSVQRTGSSDAELGGQPQPQVTSATTDRDEAPVLLSPAVESDPRCFPRESAPVLPDSRTSPVVNSQSAEPPERTALQHRRIEPAGAPTDQRPVAAEVRSGSAEPNTKAQGAAVDDIENPPAMRPFASVATFEAQRRLYDLYTMRDIYEAVILLLVFVIAAADPRISLPWYVKAQVDHFQHQCNCTLVGTFSVTSHSGLSKLPCNGHNYYRQSDQNVFTNFSCQTATRCAVDFTHW